MLRPDQNYVKNGAFPEARHLVAMDEAEFKEAVQAIEGNNKFSP